MADCPSPDGGFLAPLVPDALGAWVYADSWIWTVVGFAGAAVFGSRFILQWLRSERQKALVVPWYFWHLSFWGSSINLLYALHLDKAPLIVGSAFLPFLYGRNLVLLYRGGKEDLGKRSTE